MTATEQVNSVGMELSIQVWPSEEALAVAYMLLKEDGLLPLIWHYRTPRTLSDFLDGAKAKDVIYYVCYCKEIGSGRIEVAGLGWAFDLVPLGEGHGFKATVGQAFLRKYWSRNVARELATLCVDDGMQNRGIEVMYGFTPVKNPAAVRFISKVGFEKLCVAPLYTTFNGEPCDAVISVMTKEKWNQPREA